MKSFNRRGYQIAAAALLVLMTSTPALAQKAKAKAKAKAPAKVEKVEPAPAQPDRPELRRMAMAAPEFKTPNLPQTVKTAAEFVGDYKTPRLASGKPDLHGFWSNASVSRMTRPPGYPLIMNQEQTETLEGRALFNQRAKDTSANYVDPNAPAPEKGRALPGVGNYDVAYTDPGAIAATIKGEKRSAYITFPANGQIPAMTEEGRTQRANYARRRGTGYDNPEERGNSERCIIIGTGGPPFGNYLYNNNFQIVQTDDHFVVEAEMIHDVRIARIGGEHVPNGLSKWMGDSIAKWDGDTLVMETINVDPRSSNTFISPKGKVIEKFTRISDDQILYEFEIDDPAYAEKWGGQMPLTRLQDRLYEYACHEGNYGLVSILEGGRLNDRKGIKNVADGNRGE